MHSRHSFIPAVLRLASIALGAYAAYTALCVASMSELGRGIAAVRLMAAAFAAKEFQLLQLAQFVYVPIWPGLTQRHWPHSLADWTMALWLAAAACKAAARQLEQRR